MTKKWVKRLRILILVSIFLIVVFGAFMLWNHFYLLKNYFNQYSKYDSIQEGMNKEQVQSIMKVEGAVGPIDKYTYIKEFDEVLTYGIRLEGEPSHWVEVFYMQGEVVGKQAFSQDIPRFSIEEFNSMKKSSVRFVKRLLLMMFLGLAGGITCLIIFPRYEVIQKKETKNFGLDVLLGICLVTSLSHMILFGLGAFIMIVDILMNVI